MNWEKIRSVSLKAQTIAFTICGGTMVILLTLNGLGRYLLGMGLSWADEVTRVMFVWGCFIGMTSAFISDAHIGFDSFAKMNRTTSFISQVVNGICLVLLGLMIMIYGAQFTMKMGKFPLPASRWPIGILYSAGVAAGIAWIVIGAVKLVTLIRKGSQKKKEVTG